MSLPNYAAEARIHEMLAEDSVLETAHQDFIDEYRAGLFTEASALEHIKRARTEKPHRWVLAGAENDQLFADAFGEQPNYTKQATVVKLIGEDRAREVAKQFGTTLGGKGGKTPANIKARPAVDADVSVAPQNPWSAHPANLDARGNYSAKAIGDQSRLVRAIGETKAAQIAFAANCARLGDIRPKQRRVA